MANLSQEDFNKTSDYLYRLQYDETVHHSNRMMWIIAAQTLVFTGICSIGDSVTIYENATETMGNVVFYLMLITGALTAVSAIYSSVISEISIGSIMDDWNSYDKLAVKKKPNPFRHKMIVVPDVMLNSNLRWLALHTFVPKVFSAAWIVLILYVVSGAELDFQPVYILIYFTIALVVLHILEYVYLTFIRMRIRQKQLIEKLTPKDEEPSFEESVSPRYKQGQTDMPHCPQQCFPCCCRQDVWAIYHIMVDRFNGKRKEPPASENKFLGGDLRGIIEKLNYIRMQGFNAIMLTPIHATEAYHGYHITNYEEVDAHFGSKNDFLELILKSHQLGMKVICDFVPNHCHESHPFFQNALRNGDKRNWFSFTSGNQYKHFLGHGELPKFNFGNTEVSDYFIKVAKQMALCGVDGFRIDHAVGVPFDFLRSLRGALKHINKNIFVFGEVLPVEPQYVDSIALENDERRKQMRDRKYSQEDLQLDYSDALDGVLDFVYRDIIIEELNNGRGISRKNLGLMARLSRHFERYSEDFRPVIFLDNHDVDRIMFYCHNDKSLLDDAVAFTRSLGFPYCIYYGTEQYMRNVNKLSPDTPYSDLEVRQPMDWR